MNRTLIISIVSAAFALASGVGSEVVSPKAGEYFVYFGTYTGFKYIFFGKPTGTSHSKGIYVARFRPATGEITEPELAAEIANPSFIAIHPNHRFLYSVMEDPESLGPPLDHSSYVAAFAIDHSNGKLTLINKVAAGGTSTCFLSIDQSGKYVMLASFGNGSVSVVRINEDGSLGQLTADMQHIGKGVHPIFQTQAHPHWIGTSPDGHFAIVSDMGLDKLFIYHFDPEQGTLSPDRPPFVTTRPGGGPRHFTFHPNGKFAYVLTEMGGVVTAYSWDASLGALNQIQEVETVPKGFSGSNHSGELTIDPTGNFLYESNRRRVDTVWGPDTIGVFSIDHNKGTLTPVEQVPSPGMPRSFGIDPTGSYLLAGGEISDKVTLFRIDPQSGRLTATGKSLRVDTPVCFQFVAVE